MNPYRGIRVSLLKGGGVIRKPLLAIVILSLLLSAALAVTQETQGPRLEITGLNPVNLPTVVVSANVFDEVGQPVGDLTAADFSVVGELADRARVVSVRSFSDQAVPINVVLAIDTSSSMAGMPIELARAAARLFIESIGPNDPVAIVTFSTGARLVQDFTTNRDVLTNTINNLGFGGQTYLFDGALRAVDTAVASDNPRRAVILLSDGAQYDTTGGSTATEQDVLNQAVINGVPVYTIGLGFGADRRYLESLAANTNALFRESPTPAELEAIYSELANLLRTQYEVVLEVDVPLDGATYNLDLSVTTPHGAAQASGRLRAPVPVPFIRLPQLPTIIDSLTEVQAEIVADDPLVSVDIALDGISQLTLTDGPYLYIIDPVALAPGGHTLTITATDDDGDVGTATADFTVAALPSTISIEPPLSGEIGDVQTFSLEISGQTEPVSVTYTLDGGSPVELSEPYSITIDPFTLAPGSHFAGITVSNAGGVTTSIVNPFSVPELPIVFEVSGLAAGAEISDRAEVRVEIGSSQSPITSVTFDVSGVPLDSTAPNTAVLEALNLPPGPATLNVTAANELGQTTTASIDFRVAALPPDVRLSGIELGETLYAPRVVEIIAGGQTAITSISAQIDGAALEVTEGEPPTALLDVLALSPGTHILSVNVTNAGGQSALVEVPFTVAQEPFLTQTALVPPTESPVTATEAATEAALTEQPTEEPTTEALPTEAASPTTDAEAQAAGTATNVALNQAATSAVAGLIQLITQTAEAREQATTPAPPTDVPPATATLTVEATVDTQATADLIATVNAQATSDAEATSAAAVPTDEPTATPDTAGTEAAQAAEAQATADAAASATQAALDAQATQSAVNTATANAQAALNQQATQTAESAAVQAQAALDEQATADAQATENAALTATVAALDEQATADAEASASAQPTVVEEATSAAEATEEVSTEEVEVTPTEAGTAVAQVVEDASATPTPGDEQATPVPTITPIGTLIPAQAESAPSNETLTPIAIIVAIIVVLLLLVYFFLSRARRRTR
jgi:VWFA-related protein